MKVLLTTRETILWTEPFSHVRSTFPHPQPPPSHPTHENPRLYYATAVPSEILDAARVDGVGMLRIYRSIILPVSAPAFVVTSIWQSTSAWNDFLFTLFLTKRNTGPVTYAFMELSSAQNPDHARTTAGMLIASLPTLVVYIVLDKYFIRGLMSGSVK